VNRVAVTGIGVVSPIGSGVEAFFDGLVRGASGIDVIGSFDAGSFPTRIAGEVRDVDLPAVEVPWPEAEAVRRDRKSAFGVLASREALRTAFGSECPTRWYQPHRVAVIAAAGLEVFDLADLVPHLSQGVVNGASLVESLFSGPPLATCQIPADLGARCIAREAGAAGLYAVNVSACAAGTQALGEAFLAIREGAADCAVAGGYDSMINPLGVGGFCMLEALSTANELRGAASRPFDRRRDGFVLGEGAAFCVLENLDRARARGARVRAEILGYGSTLDAFRVTDPAEDHEGAVAAMRGALEVAKLGARDIDYVNAHGTGTRKNDPAESAAIRSVFGADADRVPVSSTKSQIGHLIGAAGAVEFLAGLFALERGMLPATINLEEPDPECNMVHVARTPRPARVRAFMSNSFGFGGQNAVIVAGRPRDEAAEVPG
jgi:3-oxoacyl-[acyl-carrier-protein] synthase II